jgi:peptide chain release factor subunit 1
MAANTITRSRLRRLAQVHPDRGRVLSVVLNLDPSELPTPAARSSAITSVMTDAAHRVEEAADLDHEEREALKADVERVRGVLGGSDVTANGTRAVAVYACQGEDLLEVVALRHPLGSRVVLDRTPYVEPLVHEGGAERWCVLLANRRVARLFTGDGEELEETDRIEDDVHSQHDQGGWSQARYQRGVEKEKDDHLQRTADVAFQLYKRRGFDRLLIGAPEELVNELEARLHSYLQKRIAGRLQCDVENSSLEEVRACAGERIVEYVRGREREALDRLSQGVGSGGRGAAGLADVLTALGEARVEALLINRGYTAAGFCDTTTGMLYASEGDAPDGVSLEPVDDIVERAIEKAIEQSAEVIGVRHHDDLGPLGGIGAVLRY